MNLASRAETTKGGKKGLPGQKIFLLSGVRTVMVEDASRFARELVTQELGILAIIKRGVRVLTASGDDLTDSRAPAPASRPTPLLDESRQITASFAVTEIGDCTRRAEKAKTPKVGAFEV